MSKISLKASNTRLLLHRTNLLTSRKKILDTFQKKWLKKGSRLKPFGFCCSLDRFDPLSRYDQRMPPYKTSLTAITSVHECPVVKMQAKFSRFSRDKKKPSKIKAPDTGNQQRRLTSELSYFQITRDNRFKKQYLEDEIALAKDIFWAERRRIHQRESNKAIRIAKKKSDPLIYIQSKNLKNIVLFEYSIIDKKYSQKFKTFPRWYQDFSPDQMKNLMKLENVMRTDYELTKTYGTQTILISIGVISTFFKLKPNTIKALHRSCNLNSVNFLRETYRILTGKDFYKEGYKKVYDCNERIILSAIAFLTLPETVKELHKRLPAVTMPKLPPKPKLITCVTRRKNICPYKEELFTCPDWAGYQNALQKWRKRCKLIAIPKIILPLNTYDQFFINDRSEIKKRETDISIEHHREISMKELQKVSLTMLDREDSSKERNLEMNKSATSNIFRSDNGKTFDFIGNLSEKEIIKRKIMKIDVTIKKMLGLPKPPGANQKSWLGKKNPHYVISGVSTMHSKSPVIYEITEVADVTPSNSDEKFFAVLKLNDKMKKVFPSGRENLSINWQEWLQNADEDYRQLEEKADELIKIVQTTIKSAFPGPVCDSCCSCRQTRKFDEKLQQSKIDNILINVAQEKEENTNVGGPMAMQSLEQNPTGSPINEVAPEDEIKTNIISDVVRDAGQIQYYISGIQRDKVHVPRKLESSVPQLKNVPPCACAIQQMADKDISQIASKEDIPWPKEEELCPGKKYRLDQSDAYFCKSYPGDKFCRHNPFMKEIMKMKREKVEKQEEEEEVKEKTKFVEAIKKEPQVPETDVMERKRDKFIPDPYPAYDYPWNISRTAPSAKIITDYEASLKMTSPIWATKRNQPSKTQETQNDISSLKELKKIKNNTTSQEINKEILSSSKKIKKKSQKSNEKKEIRDMKEKKKEPISLKEITINKRDTKSLNTIFESSTIFKTEKKQQIKSPNNPVHNNSTKQFNKFNKTKRRIFTKKNKMKDAINETEEIENRKREMARLKNMFKSNGLLGDIKPVVLPEELAAISRYNTSEEKTEEIVDALADEEKSRKISKEPCGWRTKSEQELPAKKTLVYLCEPDYPLETMAVDPGGRLCQCRENRNKKKILMYNVGGLEKINERRTRKLEEKNRIIDGVLYVTPPISPRRSDEYIPEYDILKSPYDTCVSESADKISKLIEKYSGPKSLVEKIRKKPKSCNCNNVVTKEVRDQKKELEEIRKKLMESKSPEERWKIALKDKALMDYFTQRDDNAPCWTSCKKIGRSPKPRRLKVVKPVCECKYERKIVERNEERTKWKERQQKLKALKKQSFMHIVDISKPMIEEKSFIISDVKRVSREDMEDEIKYCIAGVAEDVSMSSPQQIVDGLQMATPFQTPSSSKEDILQIAAPHRHWSPMIIPPGPLPKKDAALKEEMERRKKARDEAFKLIYGDKNEENASYLTICNDREAFDEQKLMKKVEMEKDDTKKSHASIKVETKLMLRLQTLNKKPSSKIRHQGNASNKEIVGKVIRDKNKYSKEAVGEIGHQQNMSYRQLIDKSGEKIDERSHRINGGGDKKYINNKSDLLKIVKTELKKMAAEGFTFAKLPKCYLMPQLQNWIMFREGVVFTETDKRKLMHATKATWNLMDTQISIEIKKPSLHMTKFQLRRLTYDQVKRMKKKIKKIKAIFHSKIRKRRVSYGRTMWITMEHGKFPSASFKRTFFTYMPSKEADGHVYKPWMSSEIHN
ncbi:uncharacterized protein LOC105196040 [Solenopsis invicta]|uniref:uncharacterized protein LOC105196040 n=1 Tax=Solenopsis invicta TaxID=13686 RepID=UPI00193E8AD3|nr:uncharacterized protein LOC105196040 [Solenopsis invicta]